MAADFVHLHLHTHYSMLDGACTASGLINMAPMLASPGLAKRVSRFSPFFKGISISCPLALLPSKSLFLLQKRYQPLL